MQKPFEKLAYQIQQYTEIDIHHNQVALTQFFKGSLIDKINWQKQKGTEKHMIISIDTEKTFKILRIPTNQ